MQAGKPQDPLPWLNFNSPVKGTSVLTSPGPRFGYWGEGPRNRKPYRFVLAGTKLEDDGDHSDDNPSDNGDDEGTVEGSAAGSGAQDVETLQKQLKARLKSERSLRHAKRMSDQALSGLRKVALPRVL